MCIIGLQATRAAKAAAAAPTRAATPTRSVRVKPEPGSAAAAGSAVPSAQAKSKEPGTSKRTGGGRDGYAVRQSVLDDDWEEELEDEADPLSKHLLLLIRKRHIPFIHFPCCVADR